MLKRTTNVPTLQNSIDDTFKKSMKLFKCSEKVLNVGDFVLAKMKGYAAWPSKIISFTKNKKKAKCYFHGTHNIGSVETDKIIPFEDGFSVIRLLKLRSNADFEKRVREIELINGVPDYLSSLREIQQII